MALLIFFDKSCSAYCWFMELSSYNKMKEAEKEVAEGGTS
jgi:hypothetical protein